MSLISLKYLSSNALVSWFLMHLITVYYSLHSCKDSLCIADICAMVGCIGFSWNVGKVPRFKYGVKTFHVIVTCFCRVMTRSKKLSLPPPNLVRIDTTLCISFFSTGLIE